MVNLKGTASIKICEIHPSHVKETVLLFVGDKLNTQKLLLVLECLTDRAFVP